MNIFEWDLAGLLRRQDLDSPNARFALIVLNQPLRLNDAFDTLWHNAFVRVAADGGANHLQEADQSRHKQQRRSSEESRYDNLDVIIGDLDSLAPAVRDHYTSRDKPAQVIRDTDQESTDFGKAVSWVRSHTTTAGGIATDIVALGGIGGRVDQGLSQLHHLYLFQAGPGYEQGRLFLLSGRSLTFLLKPGRHLIRVRDGGDAVFGKHVGIIPIGEPSVISTTGLEWDVEEWETRFGGRVSTSNHVLPATQVVEVETTKDVLFTIALTGME